MRDTPRTFIGSVVFLLEEPAHTLTSDLTYAEVRTQVARLPGISFCEVDPVAGTVVVTADSPVDRTDIVAVLDRLGCSVRA